VLNSFKNRFKQWVQAESSTTKAVGDAAEGAALAHLQRSGLSLVARNFKTPGRGGGEVDLIMQHGEVLVFVEVRARADPSRGGGLASVTATKQRRIALAARHFLARLQSKPACRFDVVAVQGDEITWVKGAFTQ
jgi:putative endonuclease